MSTTTPSWTDNTNAIAALIVEVAEEPAQSGAEATIDLTSVFGAWMWCHAGRTDSSALTGTAVRFNIRRTSASILSPNSSFSRVGGSVTAADTTVDANSADGTVTLNVTDTTGFAAGDLIAIMDPTPAVTRLEFHRISKVTNAGAGGELILDDRLGVAHTAAQADIVTNQADLFQLWLPGGSNYSVAIDYGGASAGSDVAARMFYQTYDSLGTV